MNWIKLPRPGKYPDHKWQTEDKRFTAFDHGVEWYVIDVDTYTYNDAHCATLDECKVWAESQLQKSKT